LKEILGKEGAQRWGQIARWEKLPDEKLIPALVRSEIEPTPHLLERVQGYVAGRGFDPESYERADRRLAGLLWNGEPVRAGDLLPTEARHYLDHVVRQKAWPSGTTVAQYVGTANKVVRSENSAIMVSKVLGRWRVSFLAEIPKPEGYRGSDWVMVDYDVARSRWRTIYRLWRGVVEITEDRQREAIRWLKPLP
jgi:hypothetical protein